VLEGSGEGDRTGRDGLSVTSTRRRFSLEPFKLATTSAILPTHTSKRCVQKLVTKKVQFKR
jgi:hypothetical protein